MSMLQVAKLRMKNGAMPQAESTYVNLVGVRVTRLINNSKTSSTHGAGAIINRLISTSVAALILSIKA